jgi:small GTP-binding protein
LPDTLLSIVVVGEFNSGKSTLINALLNDPSLLPMGSLPSTDRLTIVCRELPPMQSAAIAPPPRGGDGGLEEPATAIIRDQAKYLVVPHASLLADVTIVDTPGTNSSHARHTEETLRVLPEADWILFCTSADRPVPASEQLLLQNIATYGKKIVVVVNKTDLLHARGGDHGEAEQTRLVQFVRTHVSRALGLESREEELVVLPVSARYALAAASLRSSDGVWKRSGFSELQEFLQRSLTNSSKIKSKLSSPLGVAEQQMRQCQSNLAAEQASLEVDVATLRLLQLHIETWRSEVDRDMERSRNDVKQALEQQGSLCSVFLSRVRWPDLIRMSWLDRHTLQAEWDKITLSLNSVADHRSTRSGTTALRAHLLELVRDTADAIALRGRAQGQTLIEFLGKRPSVRQNQSLVGRVTAASRFEDTRQSLIQSLSRAVETSLLCDGEEDDSHSKAVLDQLRSTTRLSTVFGVAGLTVWATAALQLVGVFTGVSIGTALMATGGAALSSTHWGTAKGYQRLWETKSAELDDRLKVICNKELEHLERRVQDGVTPYRLFIESEQSRLNSISSDCSDVLRSAHALRTRIDDLRSR